MTIRKIGNTHVLLVGIKHLQINNVEAFMYELRSINKNVKVQVVNANFVAGMPHIMGVLQQSIEAKNRGTLLSENMEIDILLRLACTNQINKAMKDLGLKDGMNDNLLVIALGREIYLKLFRNYLATNYHARDKVLFPSKRALRLISELHGITKQEKDGLIGTDDNKLADILVEHASLL